MIGYSIADAGRLEVGWPLAGIVRWSAAGGVIVAAFFATWGLCSLVVPELGLDVVLSLAGLAAAVVSVPVGVWASAARPRQPAGYLACQSTRRSGFA